MCEHALSLGADAIEVEYKDHCEWVYARRGNQGVSIAHFESGSQEAQDLRGELYAAVRKPVRTAFRGRAHVLKVRQYDSFGEPAYDVSIKAAPPLDPAAPPSFTKKQGQYLAFIHGYTKIHRQAPAEMDMERYFRVSPPSVHEMVKTLERNGLIERTPGKARSIRVLVTEDQLPKLE